MTRERKLADSWKVLRVHADSLHSGTPHASELSGLTVSLIILGTPSNIHTSASWQAASHQNESHEGDAPVRVPWTCIASCSMSISTALTTGSVSQLSSSVDSSVPQEDAAAAERDSGIWSEDAPQPLQALDYTSSADDLALALAARRSALADKETALQRWAVALECESARQSSEQRALQAKAEQVFRSLGYLWQGWALSCAASSRCMQAVSTVTSLHAASPTSGRHDSIQAMPAQVSRKSQAVEQAEAERAELAHQAAELASEQAALREEQKAAEQEHDRLAALAAELAAQQAALTEQRSRIQEATDKARVGLKPFTCLLDRSTFSQTVLSTWVESACHAIGSVWQLCVASEERSWWLQAAEAALAQAAEQHAALKEQSQQLRLAEQDLRQRQRDAAERDSELKAFEQSLTVSAIPP